MQNPELPEHWGDIGTFVRQEPRIKGAGIALFGHTKMVALNFELIAINATIRADNFGGLSFYDKLGFRTYQVSLQLPLADGTPIDRILKAYSLS